MGKTKKAVKVVCSLIFALLVIAGVKPLQADDSLKWFRGQLHSHTYWSDGRAFPEQAVDAYKQRGYQFLSMTDHNQFAEDTKNWREVKENEGTWPPNVTQTQFDDYVKTYGKDWVKIRNDESGTSVRLKTYAEVKSKFEDPGSFILLPGVELTQVLNGTHVHLNYINLPVSLPCIEEADLSLDMEEPAMTVSKLLALNASETGQAALKLQKPYMLILNHPFWTYYDITPQNLIDCHEIYFFEICNGGIDYAPHPKALTYTVDKFWDIVNAFRLSQGKPLLYGIGSDDAHYYDEKRINDSSGVGDAWIMVRAAALTPEHLLAAMHRGDFYASNGVFLENVVFTPGDNTLRVAVKAEPGVKYRINFITTKKGFDRTVTEIASPAEKNRPARTIPLYSDDIGRTVKTVAGTEAAYRLEADDLYVRAYVESDAPSKTAPYFHSKVKVAWTQPYIDKGTPSK